MKKSYKCWAHILFIALFGFASAGYSQEFYPKVTIVESPDVINGGGTYTVSINSENSPFSWYVAGFAVTTDDLTESIDTSRNNWSPWLVTDSEWNSGLDFEIDTPGDPEILFTSGALGVGTFDSIFGPGPESKAAVFWASSYLAYSFNNQDLIGPTEMTSEFEWFDTMPNSTAFAILSGGPTGDEYLTCPVGINSPAGDCTPLNPIPIPAAVWLFGSSLIGLVGLSRRGYSAV